MYGLGLWRPRNPERSSYLRDSWCIFDLVICLAGWVDLILAFSPTSGSSANLLVLRMVRFSRVFRLIQAMNRVSNMKIMVDTIITCFYSSRYVYLFILIFIILSCTLGLTWFSDELRFKCALVTNLQDANGIKYELTDTELSRLNNGGSWHMVTAAPLIWVEEDRFCRHKSRPMYWIGRQCAAGEMCVFVDDAPFNGLFSFEHVGHAFLVVCATLLQFQWENMMLALMDATAPTSCIYFAIVAMIGSVEPRSLALMPIRGA